MSKPMMPPAPAWDWTMTEELGHAMKGYIPFVHDR